MKFLLCLLGGLFLLSCSVEKISVREGYKICKGKFQYNEQALECSSSYKFSEYSVDVRILPTVIEDKGLVEKGPFRIIMVINYVAAKKPQLEFGKSLLLAYKNGDKSREIVVHPEFDFEGKQCFIKNDIEHCRVTKTLLERVALDVEAEDSVLFILNLKSREKMSGLDSLIYNFVPYIEIKKLNIPFASV